MKDIFFAAACMMFVISLSCKPDEEKITANLNAGLTFSEDTVLFDTVFVFNPVANKLGSITKRLTVHNRNQNAVNISSISLGGSNTSAYKMIVNGKEGHQFDDQLIFGRDSLLILVKVIIDPKDKDLTFLVKDSIVFNTNSNIQDVKLVAYGQDAHFINRSILDCNTTWTTEKPYVLSDTILVDSLCQLTIEEGARIYFDINAALFIQGTLQVNGTNENRVLFRNARLDIEDAFGQWGGLFFLEGSKDNKIEFAVIRNGSVGLRVGTPDDDDTPDLVIGNTIIENMATSGIEAFNSDLYAYNTLIDNCIDFTVANYAGGNYLYEHCTFANFGLGFFRQTPAVVFTDNIPLADNTMLTNDMNLGLFNTIIHGNLSEEVILNDEGKAAFTLTIGNNLIRSHIDELNIDGNIINEDPEFVNPGVYDYTLDTLSPAKDQGLDLNILTDINANPRDNRPDLGAYERIEK